MKIYIDLYFLINYILDLTLLIGTAKVLKKEVKNIRYLLGSLVGSSSIFLLFIKVNSIELFFIKVFISTMMIIVTFGRRDFLKNIFYFYILSIILGGSFYLLDINFNYSNRSYYLNYFVLLVCSPIILYVFIKDNIQTKRANTNKYLVEITYKNDTFKTYGMIDTGNCLADPYKKRRVILVDYPFQISDENHVLVPFKALNTSGILDCFVPDKVLINDRELSNYLVGISSRNLNLCGCRCILPNDLVEVI